MRAIMGQWMVLCIFTTFCVAPARAQIDSWQMLERIDVQPGGSGSATRYAISDPVISDDGRWVIFASKASDLVAADGNGRSDIFVRDRLAQTTRLLSRRPDGAQTTADSSKPSASSNGRFVSFVSNDSLLATADTNFAADQFLLDRDTDGNGIFDELAATRIDVISLANSGSTFINGVKNVVGGLDNLAGSVTFVTLQPLVGNDTNGKLDIYVRDRATASTRLLSQSTDGISGDDDSPDFFAPPVLMSENARNVAFSSRSSNLVAGDANAAVDVFLRNRDSDGNGLLDESGGVSTTRMVVRNGIGNPLPIGPFADFSLSGDGAWVGISAFDTSSLNPLGANVYFHDVVMDADTAVTFIAANWVKGTSNCCGNQKPLLSRHGEILAFTSTQNYAIAGVGTGRSDVFVQIRAGTLTRLTDYPVPTTVDDGYSFGASAMSPNGAYLIIGVASAGASQGPADGYYVYQRNVVFSAGFD